MSDKSNTPALEFNGLVKKVDALMAYDKIDDKVGILDDCTIRIAFEIPTLKKAGFKVGDTVKIKIEKTGSVKNVVK